MRSHAKRLLIALLCLLPAIAQAQWPAWTSGSKIDQSNVAITGGTITGITDLAVADGGTGASTARQAAANLSTPHVLCQSAVLVSGAADGVMNVLYSCPIPAGSVGANGRLRYHVTFTYTNSAGTKALRVFLGGTGGTAYKTTTATTTGITDMCGTISNRNSAASQVSNQSATQVVCGLSVAGSLVTSSIDTLNNATTLDFACQKGTPAETCSVESVIVELMHGAFLSIDQFAPESLRNAVAANDLAYRKQA